MSRAIFTRGLIGQAGPTVSPRLPDEATDDLLGRGYSRRQLFRIAACFSAAGAGRQFRAAGMGIGRYPRSAAGCENAHRRQ